MTDVRSADVNHDEAVPRRPPVAWAGSQFL